MYERSQGELNEKGERGGSNVLRKSKKEDELADIRRQIAEIQGQKSLIKDEGMDLRFLPLKTHLLAAKVLAFAKFSTTISTQ